MCIHQKSRIGPQGQNLWMEINWNKFTEMKIDEVKFSRKVAQFWKEEPAAVYFAFRIKEVKA